METIYRTIDFEKLKRERFYRNMNKKLRGEPFDFNEPLNIEIKFTYKLNDKK